MRDAAFFAGFAAFAPGEAGTDLLDVTLGVGAFCAVLMGAAPMLRSVTVNATLRKDVIFERASMVSSREWPTRCGGCPMRIFSEQWADLRVMSLSAMPSFIRCLIVINQVQSVHNVIRATPDSPRRVPLRSPLHPSRRPVSASNSPPRVGKLEECARDGALVGIR